MTRLVSRDVLIISGMDGAENCANAVALQLGSRVEVATTRKAAILALHRAEFGVVVVEESLVEGDPAWADLLWQQLDMAMPMQVNFAIAGTARLTREIKAALARRDGEQQIAWKTATSEIESDLRGSVTGLLLQSELALQEPSIPVSLAPKLRQLVELAGAISDRLRPDSRA